MILALPAIVNAAWLAAKMFLPYPVVAYGEGILTWINTAVRTLGDAAWVVVRFAATNPTVQTSLGAGAAVGAASVLWMRFVFNRSPQRASNR
jgi:hypothetical protein